MLFVKPKDGLRVRHPKRLSYVIPPEGAWVAEDTAILRLINDGDLIVDVSKKEPEKEHEKSHKHSDTPTSKKTTDGGTK